MTTTNVVAIKQLAHRLESASSSERIDALSELQSLARTVPDIVGEIALLKTLNLLKEQSSAEEYCEALDLTLRLVKCRNKEIANANTALLLSDIGNVELFLELLEHADLTVGVMTSQILTELHANDGKTLEEQIQQCPDGMIKLLQRLPDSSREEVRNQAIVLIQQLTSSNEEMKKTVVFNEGFEILFKIILEEGSFGDVSIVITDCLKICQNILTDSETCQRLFYAMGHEWIIRLAEFFNPTTLEKLNKLHSKSALQDDESMSENQFEYWFEDNGHLDSAVAAVSILYHSLVSDPINNKHQNTILDRAGAILHHAAHWIARGGPTDILNPVFGLLIAVIQSNDRGCQFLSQLNIKLLPNHSGKNIPSDAESGSLEYGWKPLPNDDMKYISFLSLLAERYVFPIRSWASPFYPIETALNEQGTSVGVVLHIPLLEANTTLPLTFERACLLLFHQILLGDAAICDLIIQSILAPPPQPLDLMESDSESQPLEMMRPLGSILITSVLDVCEKLFHGHQFLPVATTATGSQSKNQLDTVDRAIHLFTSIYLNGSQLAKELTTAITVNHIRSMKEKQSRMVTHQHHQHEEMKLLLPYLLASVGKAARLPGGIGYHYIIAILQLLSVIAVDCERATHQMFEDPSNLFVVDLATASSELAGVPHSVQAMACLFLGCCFIGFPQEEKAPDSNNGSSTSFAVNNSVGENLFTRKSFIAMIDNRITMNRFMETLKKPILPRKPTNLGHGSAPTPTSAASIVLPTYDHLFQLPGFRSFYDRQLESIRTIILEVFYGASASQAMSGDSMQQQLIEMQQEKIRELEALLARRNGINDATPAEGPVSSNNVVTTAESGTPAAPDPDLMMKLEIQKQALEEQHTVISDQAEKIRNLQELCNAQVYELNELKVAEEARKKQSLITPSASVSDTSLQELQQSLHLLEEKLKTAEHTIMTKTMIEESLRTELQDLQSELESSKRINSELEMSVLAMKHSLQEKDNHIQSVQRKQQTLENEIKAAEQKIQFQQENYQQLLLDKETLENSRQGTTENYRDQIENLERLVKSLENERDSCQQELQFKDDDIINLKERIIREEKQKEAMEITLEEYQSKLRLYEQEITALKSHTSATSAPPTPSRQTTNPPPLTEEMQLAPQTKTVEELQQTIIQKTTEIQKLKIQVNNLQEQWSKYSSIVAEFQKKSLEQLERVLEVAIENCIVMNLSDDEVEGQHSGGDEQLEDDFGNEDIENHLVKREESFVTLASNDSSYQIQLKALHHLQRLVQQAKTNWLENTNTPTSSPAKGLGIATPPFTPFTTTSSPSQSGVPAATTNTFTPLPAVVTVYDFRLYEDIYQQLVEVFQYNLQSLETVAARSSDYAEGALVKVLQGSEGSLLRILDCCRSLNNRYFEVMQSEEQSQLYEQQNQELLTERQELLEKLQLSEDENIELSNTLVEIREELRVMKEKNTLSMEDVEAKVTEEMEPLRVKEQRLLELTSQLQEQQSQYQTLQEEFTGQSERLRSLELRNGELLTERQELLGKLEVSKNENIELSNSLVEIREELRVMKENHTLSIEMAAKGTDAVSIELQKKEQQLLQLQQEYEQKMLSQQNALRIYQQDATQQLQEKDVLIESLSKQLQQQQQEIIVTLQQEVHVLQSQLSTLSQQLQESISEKQVLNETFTTQLEEQQLKYSNLLQQSQQAKEGFVHQIELLEQDLQTMKSRQEQSASAQHQELLVVIENLQKVNKGLNEELTNQAEQLMNLEKKYQLQQSESEELVLSLHEEEEEKQSLQQQIQELEKEKKQMASHHLEQFQKQGEQSKGIKYQLEQLEIEKTQFQEKVMQLEEIIQQKDAFFLQTQVMMNQEQSQYLLAIEETKEQLPLLMEALYQQVETDFLQKLMFVGEEHETEEAIKADKKRLFLVDLSQWEAAKDRILQQMQRLIQCIQELREQLQSRSHECQHYQSIIEEKETVIDNIYQQTQEQVKELRQQATLAEQKYQHLLGEMETFKYQQQQFQSTPSQPSPQITQKLQQYEQEIIKLKQIIHSQQQELVERQQLLHQKEDEMKRYKDQNYLQSTVQLQQQEMKRLQFNRERDVKELRQREQEIQEFRKQLSMKAGEVEGLKITIKDLREDLQSCQQELAQITKKEMNTTLVGSTTSLSSSQLLLATPQRGMTNQLPAEETKEKLHKPLQQIIQQLTHSSYWQRYQQSHPQAATKVQQGHYEYLEQCLRHFFKDYENERRSEGVKTPLRSSLEAKETTSFATPAREMRTPLVPLSGISPIPSLASHTKGGVPTVVSTPIKFPMEGTKEKQKYQILQEQHNDLLAVLAQQEVEIKSFRKALLDRLGERVAKAIEEQTQQSIVQLYGTYMDYRQYNDDEM